MDDMKVRWLRQALFHLDRVYDYIAEDNPKAAKLVFRRIHEPARKLERFLNVGRSGQVPGTRELVVANLPYIIVYRITEAEVQILRVLHVRQGHKGLQ